MPKKAPTSIIPSRPMLTTPERSETTPPSAANTSGVAKRSIAAASADQTMTRSRFASPDWVAAIAPIAHRTPQTTAPQPSRRLPSRDDPDAEADRDQGEHQRGHRRADQQRRQREPEREEAERDRAPPDQHRALDVRDTHAAGQRRGAHTPSAGSSGRVRRGRSL